MSSQPESNQALEDLLESVDRFAALPPLSSYGEEIGGHQAWFSVIDRGFVLHAYFESDSIDFELYGPVTPGQERTPATSDPYDGSGLSGTLSVEVLKQVIRLLDNGESPREYVLQHAVEGDVVED